MGSVDDILNELQAREVPATVYVRGDLVARIRQLQAQLGTAKRYDAEHNEPDTAPAIEADIQRLSDDLTASARTFTFRGLPHHEWMTLLASCPPTDKDREQGRDYDGERFPALAMAASCIDPDDLTEAKVRDLAERLAHGQFEELWKACYLANLGVEDGDIHFFAAAIGATRNSAPSSTTAANGESPTPSSPAE